MLARAVRALAGGRCGRVHRRTARTVLLVSLTCCNGANGLLSAHATRIFLCALGAHEHLNDRC